MEEQRDRRLDASAFNRIAGVEIERDILRWLVHMPAIWPRFLSESVRQTQMRPSGKSGRSCTPS
ncbi:MAG: hypothetical protein OXI39_00090 [Gemmatimonadota bacterium]|uniref:hypothetical protein n=1 Tax=Candidatus Palauibacter scopulicola TaxID=3056741 RepID=UPI00239EBA61|nr:hypothetical protein [Candidatus Palauibacter scopulicola]MDE2661391.1 hypothetical protein [Candidatus Palauibacter scopulicola]